MLAPVASAQPPTHRTTPTISVEREVRDNLLRQPIGPLTLEVLALPDKFVRRIVDRIIRISYQERYHLVVRDAAAPPEPAQSDASRPGDAALQRTDAPHADITVRRLDMDRGIARYRQAMRQSRPFARGFRAPILANLNERLPAEGPAADDTAPIRQAAEVVARRLAYDGLVATLLKTIDVIGPHRLPGDETRAAELLRRTGFPVDLLDHFHLTEALAAPDTTVLGLITRRLHGGATIDELRTDLHDLRFRWSKSADHFQVATESGEHAIGAVRLQLTRGTYWLGAGAGGNLDVARQLIERLPKASFALAIEERHLPAFLTLAEEWSLGNPTRLTVLPSARPVSQWARDNGKAGIARAAPDGMRHVVTLVPRYASRRDDGSMFIPNESFVMDAFAAVGNTVIQSPLLFQGGNLLAVRSPTDGQRTLLVGEAEIHRNVALGLTPEQVVEAFRVEFGVDRVVVLPAASFHIDFEVTVRAHGDRLVASVNDSAAAVPIILDCGLGALEHHGLLDDADRGKAQTYLREGRAIPFVNLVGAVLRRKMTPDGHYPLSLARAFRRGAADSGVANLQRFLLAMDLLASWNLNPEQRPAERHARAYVESIRRRETDRAALRKILEALGWMVVGVPSLAEGDRGINYLNGIQDRVRYLMPAYGGLYAPLDAAALQVFRRAYGPDVEIVPVLSGESQRRGGAVHCAACVYPRVPD